MNATIAENPNFKLLMVVSVLPLTIGLQFVHFYFYYDQTFSDSVVWSTSIWFVWFVVIGGAQFAFHQLPSHVIKKGYWFAFAGVVLFSGLIQITLSTLLTDLYKPPTRPLWEDVLHLYNKRWLQNLFFAGFLWQFFNFLWPLKPSSRPFAKNGKRGQNTPLKISEGKTVYWIKPRDIRYVQSEKNYLFIVLENKKICVRQALKKFFAKLDPVFFVQVNRSCLVNKAYISCLESYSRHSKQVRLTDGTVLKIGRTYLPKIGEAL